MTATLFKVGGRSIPMQRAIAMGLADAEGNALKQAPDSQGARLIAKEARAADWAAKQAKAPRTRSTSRKAGTGTAPETTEDGKIRRKREPKPLVPQNVTPEGEPITDEETLDEIAARTAAIEALRESVGPYDANAEELLAVPGSQAEAVERLLSKAATQAPEAPEVADDEV